MTIRIDQIAETEGGGGPFPSLFAFTACGRRVGVQGHGTLCNVNRRRIVTLWCQRDGCR
jgi:hypothetical protein